MNIYGVCDNNCKHLVYTREEVLALLQQAINEQSLLGIDADFAAIKKIIDTNGGEDIKFWIGTEAEFNALDPKPSFVNFIPRRCADGMIYICTDDSGIDLLPTDPMTDEEIDAICV